MNIMGFEEASITLLSSYLHFTCIRMRRQNEIIENCKRTVAETEEIGIETIAELQNNREKIESARAKVRTSRKFGSSSTLCAHVC